MSTTTVTAKKLIILSCSACPFVTYCSISVKGSGLKKPMPVCGHTAAVEYATANKNLGTADDKADPKHRVIKWRTGDGLRMKIPYWCPLQNA